MRSKQLVVTRGSCPLCSTKMEQIGHQHNYDLIDPEFKVTFYGCKTCNRLWEWKESMHGQLPEIIDVAGKLRQIEKGIGIAT